MPKTGKVAETRGGIRSPMHGHEQQESHRKPSTAGTSEVIHGSAPKPNRIIESPTKSRVTKD